MTLRPFSGEGQWFKGCLHCHSTVSPDGMYSPLELKELYKSHGYSFLALTDHDRFTWHKDLTDPDFLIWPAGEAAINCTDESRKESDCHSIHLNALYGGTVPEEDCFSDMEWISSKCEKKEDYFAHVQEMIDRYREKGCIVTLNHPIWSKLRSDDVRSLTGYFGLEIYNSGAEHMDATDFGAAALLWDDLLRQKRNVCALAVDDTHGTNILTKPWSKIPPDSGRFEGLRGWVCVYARELSPAALSQALLEGKYYASSGPAIEDIQVDDGVVKVTCSPVEKIRFITYERRGRTEFGEKLGDLITGAQYRLHGNETYVRVECVDEKGRAAWSHPIFLK